MRIRYSLILLNCLIYISFFLGFILKENSAGGGETDFHHIYNNIILFKNFDLNEINWFRYESTALPIYYLIIKYFGLFDVQFLNLFNFILAISIVLIFYLILLLLKKNNKLLVENYVLFSISSLLLLSPYFRTSTFWSLEENIGYLFMLLSIYFAFKSQTKLSLILSIFFACLAFYSRQSYAFIVLVTFFFYYKFNDILSTKNLLVVFLFSILLLPSLYFFFQWNGLIPPYAAADRAIKFQTVNIPVILSICLFYIIPFFILEDKNKILNFLIKKKIIFVITLLLFFLFFYENIQTNDVYYKIKLGGGILYKLIFHFNFLIQDFILQKILFVIISWLGFISIFFYSKKSLSLAIFFIIFIIIFSNANIIFQEYFDPMITILIIIFYKTKDPECNFTKLYFMLFSYKSVLLLSSLMYYYKFI